MSREEGLTIAAASRAAKEEQKRAEFVKLYLERPICVRITQLLRDNKVGKNLYYGWMKIPEFRAAIDAADVMRRTFAIEPVRSRLNDIVAIQVQKALDGDTEAAKYVTSIEGMYNPKATPDFVLLNQQANQGIDLPQSKDEAIEAEASQRDTFDRYRELEEDEYTVITEDGGDG